MIILLLDDINIEEKYIFAFCYLLYSYPAKYCYVNPYKKAMKIHSSWQAG
jgi:hypothetical protein